MLLGYADATRTEILRAIDPDQRSPCRGAYRACDASYVRLSSVISLEAAARASAAFCPRRVRSMPDINDPEYWQQRAKEARLLAERMPRRNDIKQTMLSVAEECDRFAIRAAMCSIYERAVSRVTDC